MIPTTWLGTAYTAMGLVGIAAYAPQFFSMWRSREAALHAPLLTWLLWTVQTSVAFLYALLVNHDHLFIILTFLGMSVTIACLTVLLWQRYRRVATAQIVPFTPPTPVNPQAPEKRAA